MKQWKRWGKWKAHLYDGDLCLCPSVGKLQNRGVKLGDQPSKLEEVTGSDLMPGGIPYSACRWCVKRAAAPEPFIGFAEESETGHE